MRFAVVAIVAIAVCSATSYAQGGMDDYTMKTTADTLGYLTGMQIAKGLDHDHVQVNVAIMNAGIEDAMTGDTPLLSQELRAQVLVGLQTRAMDAQKKVEAEGDSIDKVALNVSVFGTVTPNNSGRINSRNDSVSYSIGFNIGDDIKANGMDVSPKAITAATIRYSTGKPALLTDDDILNINFRMQQENNVKAEENAQKGIAFLNENRQREGVVVLPSGLQYEILKKGTGKRPSITDKVTVHYTGTLIDGTVFDSSIERGKPATFPLKGVIKGWTEALQLMPVGSKWKLFIPAELAYGPQGAGKIGPNETLIFEVELLSIN